MPETSGLAAFRELSTLTPVRTLLLTADAADRDVVDALQLGARGVVMKQVATAKLFEDIRRCMAGQYWVGECVGALSSTCGRGRSAAAAAAADVRVHPAGGSRSSPPSSPATNHYIAKQFSISAKTVKYH